MALWATWSWYTSGRRKVGDQWSEKGQGQSKKAWIMYAQMDSQPQTFLELLVDEMFRFSADNSSFFVNILDLVGCIRLVKVFGGPFPSC